VSTAANATPDQLKREDDELRDKALKLLTAWTHGDLFRYCDERNHNAVRHIFAIAERKYPADTNPEAKEWYEFEHMLLLATIYKVHELRTGTGLVEAEAL
jgi:hypothetical protein